MSDKIPQHQVGVFTCPDCKDSVWEQVPAVKFMFDRLAPDKMQPVPCPMYQCLSCRGYLTFTKEGGYKVVHKEAHLEGDEWKTGGV